MDIWPRISAVSIALALATAGVILATVTLQRPSIGVSAQVAGSAAPQVVIAPQPNLPVQILSVTPLAQPPPPGFPASVAANFRAFDVVLKNVTNQDAMVFALQLTGENFAQTAPVARKFSSRFATSSRGPAVAAGQTQSHVVNLTWRADELAVRIDVVLLRDGTAFGPNMSRAVNQFQDDISSRQGVLGWALSTLQAKGPQETERLLTEQLALADDWAGKYMTPNWVH